jgi:hypothetical protein
MEEKRLDKDSTSLFKAMERHYVDEDGKTIQDAVQLGMSILYFYHGMHEARLCALEEDQKVATGILDDFFYTICMDHMSIDRFNAHRQVANVHLDMIQRTAPKTADILRKWLYGEVLDILENKIYQTPLAGLPLHIMLCEGAMRIYNAYVFTTIRNKGPGYDYIAAANVQCSLHVLSFIAFLVSQDMREYIGMNMEVERYMYTISSKILEPVS